MANVLAALWNDLKFPHGSHVSSFIKDMPAGLKAALQELRAVALRTGGIHVAGDERGEERTMRSGPRWELSCGRPARQGTSVKTCGPTFPSHQKLLWMIFCRYPPSFNVAKVVFVYATNKRALPLSVCVN